MSIIYFRKHLIQVQSRQGGETNLRSGILHDGTDLEVPLN